MALALHQAKDNVSGQVATLETLGFVATRTGSYAEAVMHYERALILCRSQRNSFVEAQLLEHLAAVYLRQGQLAGALDTLLQAQDLYAYQHRRDRVDHVRRTVAGIEDRLPPAEGFGTEVAGRDRQM